MAKPKKRRTSRAKRPDGLPKGAYRWPTGGYATTSVGPVGKNGRRIVVTAVRREHPDFRRLMQLLIEVAKADQDAAQNAKRDRPSMAA